MKRPLKVGGQYVLDHIGQLLTLEGAVKKKGRHIEPQDLSIIHDAALVVSRGKILWAGPQREVPKEFKKYKKLSAERKMVVPGFVDSHTHLVFSGDRSNEFEMRLAGKSYQEIAQGGGGIARSTNATRKASKNELFLIAKSRVDLFLKQGVTTLEIKTGYGLNFEAEKKCLEVISLLKTKSKATIKATYLAGHAVPIEYTGRKDEYVKILSQEWLPKLRRHIDFADMFVDDGYFSTHDVEILIEEARKHKIPIKLHADELKLTGGTRAAIKCGALSCDHLLQITANEVELLARSETTATLLPTTAFFLNVAYAPARLLLDGGARVALATDFNPGTSPTQDVSLVGLLGALKMKMRIDEIVVAMTLNGAYALGLQETKGACMPGYDADFILLSTDSPARLFYEFGERINLPQVFCAGQPVN